MTRAAVETEVKFYVQDLPAVRERLTEAGASVLAKRVHELNLRFDTAAQELRRSGRALRLRRDDSITLTFKGPSNTADGIRTREEIEVRLDDLERGQDLLTGLGYHVTFTYEKYRTTYGLLGAEVMLDELPYGDFVEIEGDGAVLKAVAEMLGLSWSCAVTDSYAGLFDKVVAARGLQLSALTFVNFAPIGVEPADLGVTAADL
jgi:adenylate cyclase class 2